MPLRRRQHPAQPGAQGAHVAVGGIVHPPHAGRAQRGAQAVGRNAQQWAQQPRRRARRGGGHARQPVRPAALDGPQQQGLRLIGPMMGQQQIAEAGLGAGGEQRRMPRLPRRRRAAAGRQAERQDAHRDAQAAQPAGGQRRLIRQFRAQPMVRHQRQRFAPRGGQHRQRHAVAAAGTGHGHAPRRVPRPERRHQPGELRRRQRRGGAVAQRQPARERAAATLSRRSGRGVGNWPRSVSSASQAERLSFSAISEFASPTSASWAWLPATARW